ERFAVTEENTAAWGAEGREPIVIRCGVAPRENYEAGAQLEQISEIPWFQDTTLGEGTTAGTWFAFGRDTDIAISAAQDVANTALEELAGLVSATTGGQDKNPAGGTARGHAAGDCRGTRCRNVVGYHGNRSHLCP